MEIPIKNTTTNKKLENKKKQGKCTHMIYIRCVYQLRLHRKQTGNDTGQLQSAYLRDVLDAFICFIDMNKQIISMGYVVHYVVKQGQREGDEKQRCYNMSSPKSNQTFKIKRADNQFAQNGILTFGMLLALSSSHSLVWFRGNIQELKKGER